jgi:acyl-CoA synthetase (AMP-forming)/AMP-acid ligase II/acyl carrier protein
VPDRVWGRFEAVAAKSPNRIAMSDERGAATFAELARHAKMLADRAITPGTIVMSALPGGTTLTTWQLACFAAEGIFVPIPAASTLHEASTFVDLVPPDVLLVASIEEQAAVIEACPEHTIIVTVEPAASSTERIVALSSILYDGRKIARPSSSPFPPETRSVQFTSGSTGKPKGILLAESSWLGTLDQNREHLSNFEGKDVFCPLPQFHAMGNAVVIEHLFHGSPIHLANEFVPGAHVKTLQTHRCAAILASPNYFKLMGRLGVLTASAIPTLEAITLGTAAIDETLVRELRGHFPDIFIHCRYGLSESVGAMVRLSLGAGETLREKGLIGDPVPGVEVFPGLPSNGDPKELRVKSAANAIGVVWARGEWKPLLDDDGYLSTGDLALRTPDGQLLVRGRLSTFLKSNGYRINPFEIEDVLRAVPSVQEAVVVGVPDEAMGQRIIACVEGSAPERAVLLAACERALSAHKVPQGFLVLAPMPRTKAGKPDRTRILDEAIAFVAASAGPVEDTSGLDVRERVLRIVTRVIRENVGHEVAIGSGDDLVQAGYLDSLTMVSLVLALQEELAITIPVVNLTPDQFASVDVIVGYIEGGGRAAETAMHRRAEAPMRSLLGSAILAAILLLVFRSLPSDDRGPLTARAFRRAKGSCVGCAELVIAGSSQAMNNISPAVMSQALGLRTFNLGLNGQPYNAFYLDMVERALAASPRRGVLMVITPISLVPRSSEDEAENALEAAKGLSRYQRSLERIRDAYPSRQPCELLPCDARRTTWRYDDGWTAETFAGGPPAPVRIETMSRFMRRWGAKLHATPEGARPALDRVRKWRAAGIQVWAVRAPAPASMIAAERTLPGFDEDAVTRAFADAGATWLTVDPSAYETFDGWHMDRDTAIRFSSDLAARIMGTR